MAAVERTRLHIDMDPGDAIDIGGIIVRVVWKSGTTSKLSVEAPREIPVTRVPSPNGNPKAKP